MRRREKHLGRGDLRGPEYFIASMQPRVNFSAEDRATDTCTSHIDSNGVRRQAEQVCMYLLAGPDSENGKGKAWFENRTLIKLPMIGI